LTALWRQIVPPEPHSVGIVWWDLPVAQVLKIRHHSGIMGAGMAQARDIRIWVLALGTFAIGTDVFVVSGILPAIAAHFGTDLEAAGQTVTAYALTYALAAPLLVPLTATLKQVRVVIVTLAIFALANALCAAAPTYWTLMVVRVLAGAVAALYTSTAYALAASLAQPHRKGAAIATVALGLTASAVFGVPLGTAIGEALGWRMTFWLITAISAAAVAALVANPPLEQPVAGAVPSYAARMAPLKQRNVLLALAPSLLWNTANLTSYTYLGAVLSQRFAPHVVVILFSVYGIGGLIGSQLGGRLVDRFGAMIPLAACLAIAAVNQALMGFSLQSAWMVAPALAIWSITGWGTFAPQQARLIDLAPGSSALVIALNHSTIYIGTAIGAGLGGAALARGLALDDLHWITVALLSAALLVLVATGRSLRRLPSAHAADAG
jgi:predicted MFS family arabinose efflux permease